MDEITSVGDRYSIPQDHPYEKLRKFISNVRHGNKKGVEFIYRLQFSVGQGWPPGHINPPAEQGCAWLTVDWISADTHAVATQKSQVRSQKHGKVCDSGPQWRHYQIIPLCSRSKPEGMDTTAKARVSDRKRGSEVAHNSHPIPTGSFLGIEHSSPKYPKGTLPHG